ncbi:MAG: hypothetical protein A2493_02315 [Candidatus Magasanikbacteria bacterium RIFOXYC12_FULL_33_11]|uniref:histidine kinase n=1 Tax=Candidatus Magasanikbacteria bacterium RIFOXYC12_FULL_33_11 TaxID=1798701 RepID=A0A1F6NPB6_9BACT|nr:MAG: hypothetical protein A2493_02315 [Candidatus Magasanikbacteria bacterium RIFOXYC12_FULL_33_11]
MNIISTYSLLPLISSLFVITLGFFVWMKRPKEQLHILFFLYSFTISLWLLGTFFLFNATNELSQIKADRLIYAPVVFIPIFLYHFGLLYCKCEKKQKHLLILGYILAFLFLPLSQTDYFLKGLYYYKWGVHTVAQTWHHIFLIYFAIYFILFFLNLVKLYKKSVGISKKQIKYLLVGFAILDSIGPLAFLPAYGIPVYPIVFLSGVPFAIIVAYAIIKLNALDLKTIAVEVVVTVLNFVILLELFFSKSFLEALARGIVLIVVVIFSSVLVHSVKKEIKRREELVILANNLEKANLRLQELDQQKTEFLSIASHQLRTPLTIIRGYIELIGDGAYGKVHKPLKEVLKNMDESNDRLMTLVEEFLDITRIEQGRTKFTFEDKNINDLIDSVVKELSMKPEFAVKKLKIVWKPEKEITNIYMDEEKIRHVVFNFLDNSIKYSDKGTIKVSVEKEDNGYTVRIKDQGFGFNKEDEVNFFQKFYRGKNVQGTNVNGTGLGIYVCKRFIEKHGGHVWAKSPGLGKGSEFGFWIPGVKGKENSL